MIKQLFEVYKKLKKDKRPIQEKEKQIKQRQIGAKPKPRKEYIARVELSEGKKIPQVIIFIFDENYGKNKKPVKIMRRT